MPGRKYTATSSYRYGFNGKENDNEVKGEGNQQDYGMRIFDPRLGRFLSVDALTESYPMLTPYQFASNSPIGAIDLDGLEAKISTSPVKTGTFENSMFNKEYVRKVSNSNAFALQTEITDKIYNQIQGLITGDGQTTIRKPSEVLVIKQTIRQFIIVNPGFDYKNQKIAIAIPGEDGSIKALYETTYDGLDKIGVAAKVEDLIKDKINKKLLDAAGKLIELSEIAPNKSGKKVLQLFGKVLSIPVKAVKIYDIAKDVLDAPNQLNKGEIPVLEI